MDALTQRAGGRCELCGDTSGLGPVSVDPSAEVDSENGAWLCMPCGAAIAGERPLNDERWFCLREAIWSEVPAVQVLAYRLLHRVEGAWASDLIDQAYLDEDTLAWAERGLGGPDTPEVVDCHGTPLADGDSVTLIKDLVVKGANFTAKRGTLVKKIRLGDDPTHVEGRVQKTSIMLKTCFLKRA